MIELEKLLEKFEGMVSSLQAEMTNLKKAQTDLVAKQENWKDLEPKIKALEDAYRAREQTLVELKALVGGFQKDCNEYDPSYGGVMTKDGGGERRLRAFPNARRAKEYGLFIVACAEAGQLSNKALMALNQCNKALAEGVNSTGGALVPEIFTPTLIRLKERYGIFRANVSVVPMASDKQIWPASDGDVTVYAPGEAGSITASNPTFKNVKLAAEKLAALVAISSELDEDSLIAVGEICADSFARAFAKAEDQIGFLGDGTSTYWGFTGITGSLRNVDSTIGNVKSLVVGNGNAYSELLLGDFDKIVGLFPEYADDDDCAWYMHRYFYWTVVRPLIQAYSSNKPTIGETIDSEGRPRFTLRGYPVRFTSVMPKTEANSQICAIFGNLRMGCYLGERRGMTVDRSREVYFASDQIAIRATQRIAVNAFGVGDTTDPGPIMALITAAS